MTTWLTDGRYNHICNFQKYVEFSWEVFFRPLWSGLVQKAKKAKDKLLKRDGDDRPETGSYESFYYGGVDPYMWEPQELGGTERLTVMMLL